MRKRALLMLVAGSLLAFATQVQAQPIEFKVSHYLPPNHTIQKVLEDWGKEVEQRSAGRMTMRIYPASQLGPVQRQFDLARNGQADMVVGLTGATPGRYPMTELATGPFIAPSTGTTSEAQSRRATELAPKYLAPEFQGLHLLWVGVPPDSTVFTAKREITTLADMKGLKLRFQGEQLALVLRALSAVPLQVPPGEIADGMSKGVIDGAMFNYEAAESFGLGSVTKHVVEPGFLSATLVLAMNQAKYDGLAPDLRAIIDETTGPAAATKLGQRWDIAEKHGRDAMLAAKVEINTLPPAEMNKLKLAMKPVVADAVATLEKAGKPATQFLADYTK